MLKIGILTLTIVSFWLFIDTLGLDGAGCCAQVQENANLRRENTLYSERYQRYTKKYPPLSCQTLSTLPKALQDPQSQDLHLGEGDQQESHLPEWPVNQQGGVKMQIHATSTQTVLPTQNLEFWEQDTEMDQPKSNEDLMRGKSFSSLSTSQQSPQSETLKIDLPMTLQRPLLDRDFIEDTPHFQVTIRDDQHGVSGWEMTILNEKNERMGARQNQVAGPDRRTTIATLTLPNALPNGTYQLEITATNSIGESAVLRRTGLRVDTAINVIDPLIGPNPYNPNQGEASIEYQLSQMATVKIVVMALDGQVVWQREIPLGMKGAQAGFNKVTWDGKDQFTRTVVATGAYILYIVAEKNGKKSVGKVKCLVRK
jgi:hypothetical protein